MNFIFIQQTGANTEQDEFAFLLKQDSLISKMTVSTLL
ncbi:hypothetical protein SAMN05216565_10352 [Litchfieldia salsa]|uniref:Uncharacterized protein n=1 Tax=Litchfieldia salsa TaxID=930152 RepID=A0A1H0SR06_9BACI|nr:hypothetical protein SAMN05216565_10352 [Litchfieldia salsa]